MIRTAITELLGIEHPIIQAGMGSVAGSELAAAVCNAIYDAVGVRVYELPATPERVLQGLRSGERR